MVPGQDPSRRAWARRHATTRVPGELVTGRICTRAEDDQVGDRILLVKSLELDDYRRVVASRAVICERCADTSHIAIVCRILGVPVVTVEGATRRLSAGDTVTVNPRCEEVLVGGLDDGPAPAAFKYERPAGLEIGRFRYQLSILAEPTLVERVNSLAQDEVEQFFLREELVWVAKGQDPYAFLRASGIESLAAALHASLGPIAEALEPRQALNFRALDLRSDQLAQFGDEGAPEPNPHLGLHGIRRLLVTPGYLVFRVIS